MYLTLLLSLFVCSSYLACSAAQPLCRDLHAPFPYDEAAYCPEYGGFGCCGKKGERRAGKWAADAQRRLVSEEDRRLCDEYTRNVSCLTCSPLADRIFRGDDPESNRIPLCHNYCVETYVNCRFSLLRLFKLHPWRQGLVKKYPDSREELQLDAESFCEQYASDSPYCYPDVTILEQQFVSPPSQLQEESKCVCLVPVVSGLHLPNAALFPEDRTRRMFIQQRSGELVIFDTRKNRLLQEPLLNLSHAVETSDRGGHLDLTLNSVLHPDFKRNGRIFILYTVALNTSNGLGLFSLNLSEFRVSLSNHNQVDYSSGRLLLSAVFNKQVSIFHLHGGGLFFKNRLLYIAIGRNPDLEDVFNL